MKNLAGNEKANEYVLPELEEAKIPHFDLEESHGEVPSTIIGFLNGWTFTRAWYYWVAHSGHTSFNIELDVAEPFHNLYGKEVRTAGYAGGMSPKEWYDKPHHNGVDCYHIDTQDGLNAFADLLRKIASE